MRVAAAVVVLTVVVAGEVEVPAAAAPVELLPLLVQNIFLAELQMEQLIPAEAVVVVLQMGVLG
jgi:hypothetical protein